MSKIAGVGNPHELLPTEITAILGIITLRRLRVIPLALP
jgi:hypothetical protein